MEPTQQLIEALKNTIADKSKIIQLLEKEIHRLNTQTIYTPPVTPYTPLSPYLGVPISPASPYTPNQPWQPLQPPYIVTSEGPSTSVSVIGSLPPGSVQSGSGGIANNPDPNIAAYLKSGVV